MFYHRMIWNIYFSSSWIKGSVSLIPTHRWRSVWKRVWTFGVCIILNPVKDCFNVTLAYDDQSFVLNNIGSWRSIWKQVWSFGVWMIVNNKHIDPVEDCFNVTLAYDDQSFVLNNIGFMLYCTLRPKTNLNITVRGKALCFRLLIGLKYIMMP